MIPLNYHHLFYFYTIATEGTVGKAAKALFLAQPTLSAQLKQLEQAFGRPLFRREGRRLELNEDGRVVMRYAAEIFRLGRELTDDLRDRPEAGRVTVQLGVVIGTPRAVVHSLTRAALAAGAFHADVREAALPDLLEALTDHSVDAVLSDSADATHADSIRWKRVAKLPVRFVAVPSLARKRPRLPWGLEGESLILPKAPADVYRQVQAYLAQNGVAARVICETPDVETARRLALDGLGAAPLNELTLAASLPRGGLMALAGPTTLTHSFWLAVSAKRIRQNPVAEKLLRSFSLGQKG